jgi:2-keto-4-pentenoate hydratase/2-oxohepta-3-ene-1,7-dioic acid hydratase in catechol pathway
MLAGLAVLAVLVSVGASSAQRPPLSDRPDTPFKLATFEAQGRVRLGLALGAQVFDLAGANTYVAAQAGLPAVQMPGEMRALIEQYDTLSRRLYQVANFLRDRKVSEPFAFRIDQVTFKAPIKYPWNLLAAAANYKAHAEGMGAAQGQGAAAPAAPPGQAAPPAAPRGGFNASVISQIDPDRDAPVMFAKSPRSCIIDPGEPYYIPAGRTRIDWEGEMVIVMGKPAYQVPRERAHEYVFGYSVMYDVSDRGGRDRKVSMFPGANWFEGKSTDRAAPFGPFIVPKEFLPNHNNLRLVTKINGVVKQEGNTRDLIWDEPHLINYLTTILTLYPGDVIMTGTPSGTGAERNEFLKPGDVVTIELEGVGTLVTPMRAQAGTN